MREFERTFQQEDYYPYNESFVWNFKRMRFYFMLDNKSWAIPVIHGFLSSMNLEILGTRVSIILISRRSRHFAGTRYLKRGLDE